MVLPRTCAFILAFGLLSISTGLVVADDANSPEVKVKFSAGSAEVIKLTAGAQLVSNRDGNVTKMPDEMSGLMFTRHASNVKSTVTIDAPANAVVYLFLGSGPPARSAREAANNAGFQQIGNIEIDGKQGELVFKKTFTQSGTVTIASQGVWGTQVAAKNIKLDGPGSSSATSDASPTADPLAGAPKDNTPSDGTVRVAVPQASIVSLEVTQESSGMMLGQTSDLVLTVTRSDSPREVDVQFVTGVGNDMNLSRDEAIRFIRVTYQKWYAQKAEITFEDKYDHHDGGSIGAAVGTLILSTIRGFKIDPHIAITGDISADGKIRSIGGVSAKIRGAVAGKCDLIAIPTENYDQFVDAVIYNGLQTATDIQVLGIADMDSAIATVRADRDPQLAQAIVLFSSIQKSMKTATYINSKEAQYQLSEVLKLMPDHLSARALLAKAQGKLPKTLSATASMYYMFVAVNDMMKVLNERAAAGEENQVPSLAVQTGLKSLQKLHPIADDSVRPLIDAWASFIQSWESLQQGSGTAQNVERRRQIVLDQMAKQEANADLMQKMLKEGY